MRFFSYTRSKEVAKTDETGKVILKKDAEGKEIPGQAETETKNYIDHFNLDYVLRTFSVEEDHIIVLLDDGHEVTEKVPVLKNKSLPARPNNIVEESKIYPI